MMAAVVTAPTPWQFKSPSLFLAGGISGCSDWQAQMIASLQDEDVTLLNPRRPSFPIDDPNAAEEQIRWEYDGLLYSDAILFWFPQESICPIALFELGAWLQGSQWHGHQLFVATHPDYPRRQDVVIQTRLARPDITVGNCLGDLIGDVQAWLAETGA